MPFLIFVVGVAVALTVLIAVLRNLQASPGDPEWLAREVKRAHATPGGSALVEQLRAKDKITRGDICWLANGVDDLQLKAIVGENPVAADTPSEDHRPS